MRKMVGGEFWAVRLCHGKLWNRRRPRLAASHKLTFCARAASVIGLRLATGHLLLPHSRLKRLATSGRLLFRLAAVGRNVVGIEPGGFFGREFDFQIAAEHLGSENVRSRLNGVRSD